MSEAGTASLQTDALGWRPMLALVLVIVALLLAKGLAETGTRPLYGDTDDAMRMVSVIDMLEGRGWFDYLEPRDNTPFGASLHWSKLIDAPIAGLTMLLAPSFGTGAADAAAMVWPLLLAFGLLALSVTVSSQLAGPDARLPAIVLPVLCFSVLDEFLAGRVDHHNVQLLLTLGLVATTIAAPTRPAAAMLAGLAAAASLAVGMETLPFVIVAIVVFGFHWVADPRRARTATLVFALSLAAATALFFVIAVPAAAYLTPACDFISVTYVVASALAALALAVATYLGAGLRLARQRFGLLLILGGAAAALVLWLYPACAGGPYAAVDPFVVEVQFPMIVDTWPPWRRFSIDPAFVIAALGVPVAGLAVMAWRALVERDEARRRWLVLLAFGIAAAAITTLQLRGARFSTLLALPAGAWLVGWLRNLARTSPSGLNTAKLLGGWLIFAASLHLVLANLALGGPAAGTGAPTAGTLSVNERAVCFRADGFAQLAALPPSAVVAPLDLGAHILRYTAHSVTSAGYHRNAEGIKDVVGFFTGDEATARAIAEARGLRYVATCGRLHEMHNSTAAAADSFVVNGRDGRLWPWLTPVSSSGAAIQIFRIEP